MAAPKLHAIHQQIDEKTAELKKILKTGQDSGVTLRQEQLDQVRATIEMLDTAKATLVCIEGFSAYSEP
jgi:hypothetical protein